MQTRSQIKFSNMNSNGPFGYSKHVSKSTQNIVQKKSSDQKLRRSKRIANMPKATYVFDFQFDFEEKPVEKTYIPTPSYTIITPVMNNRKCYNTRSTKKL